MICDDTAGRHWARLMNGNRGVKRDLGFMHNMNGWCRHAGSYVQYADINGDGKDDYICDDSYGNHWIKLSHGNGNWQDLGRVLHSWCGHGGAVTRWADLNGDGKADIVCDDKAGRHWTMLGNGNGKFTNVGMYLKGWCGGNHIT